MQILCPYCHSENIQRMLQSPYAQSHSMLNQLSTSTSFLDLGATLTKNIYKQVPVSPWMGGIAGAVIGGVLKSLFEAPQPRPQAQVSYFYCQDCQHTFQ